MPPLVLEFVEGGDAGRKLDVTEPLDIGRDPAAGLVVADDQVSRRHARLTPHTGGARVEDLGSTNGTYVNDQAVHAAREIEPGDRIRVGLTVLELRTPAQVAAVPSAVGPRPDITRLGEGVLRFEDLPSAPAAGGFEQAGAPAPGQGPQAPGQGPPPVAAQQQAPPPVGRQQAPGPVAPEQQPLPAGQPPQAPAQAPGAPPQEPQPNAGPPAFRAAAQPPAYVPPEVAGDAQAHSDFQALQVLVDTRVKRRTTIAMFAILAIAALALLVFFGASTAESGF